MKITKHEHATLHLSIGDDSLVIDPGSFLSAVDFGSNVAAIVITHEHADHWTPEQLGRITEQNPDAVIIGPAGVAAAASGFDVQTVTDGDSIEAGPFRLRFFGTTHNVIHESIPTVDNTGVLVNDELYYPGDSYTVPDTEVRTLAAPVGAPWLKIGEAMDFILAVKPKRSFPVHDMTLSAAGKKLAGDRLQWATEKNGGEFHVLEVGETLDV